MEKVKIEHQLELRDVEITSRIRNAELTLKNITEGVFLESDFKSSFCYSAEERINSLRDLLVHYVHHFNLETTDKRILALAARLLESKELSRVSNNKRAQIH